MPPAFYNFSLSLSLLKPSERPREGWQVDYVHIRLHALMCHNDSKSSPLYPYKGPILYIF